MYKDKIAIPCVVNGLHTSKFLYMSYTRVSQLFCLTYCVKVQNLEAGNLGLTTEHIDLV